MSAIASNYSLFSASFSNCVSTRAAEESSLASSPLTSYRRAWKRFVDFTLVEMGKAAGAADDDEMRAPTVKSVRSAIGFSIAMAETSATPLPSRYAPTGIGGLAFEWQVGEKMIRVEFFEDGGGECVFFAGLKVVRHELIV